MVCHSEAKSIEVALYKFVARGYLGSAGSRAEEPQMVCPGTSEVSFHLGSVRPLDRRRSRKTGGLPLEYNTGLN